MADPQAIQDEPDELADVSEVLDEPLVGWRCWRWSSPSRRLMSMMNGTPWPPYAALAAICKRPMMGWMGMQVPPSTTLTTPPHPSSPKKDCSCGIYVAKDMSTVRAFTTSWTPDVVGKAALWGAIEEGSKGYRAEFAYPVELWIVAERFHKEAGCIGHTYGVPVHCGKPPENMADLYMGGFD